MTECCQPFPRRSSCMRWLDTRVGIPHHKPWLFSLRLCKSEPNESWTTRSSPPKRSKTALTSRPDASSTTRYRPPGRTPARLIIWASVSGRISLIRLLSLLNQNSQTLCNVGSIVLKTLENLWMLLWHAVRVSRIETLTSLPCAFCTFLYCTLFWEYNSHAAQSDVW